MTKMKLFSKLTPVLLMVAIFCSACDVPDISEFTKQSAEMTRGIRTGVKDTETLIKTAAGRDDLYSDETIATLNKDLKTYQGAVKPTVAALDALDSYLEALNALAQANKKSGENASAAVTSVGNLVTAVSGLTFASSVVNVATGLLTLEEKFRTAKDFKKRVNLAGEIVEGRYTEKRNGAGQIVVDEKGKPVLVKACTEKAEDQITEDSKAIKVLFDQILANAHLTEAETNILKPLSPQEKREKLKEWGKMSAADAKTISDAETRITSAGCGVIDFIKFNIKDLKEINQAVADDMYTNAREKNRVVLGFYDSIVANDRGTQNELERILNYKALIPVINQYVQNGAGSQAVKTKITLKNTLDSIFILDSGIKVAVLADIGACSDCGEMQKVLTTATDRNHCNAACRAAFVPTVAGITDAQFAKSDSLIAPILNAKAASLSAQNKMYLEELARIRPSYDSVSAELKSMKDKQEQLDAVLDSSLKALDAWAKTHANLRVAVNTKRPLTVSKLASEVRDMWAILKPETK